MTDLLPYLHAHLRTDFLTYDHYYYYFYYYYYHYHYYYHLLTHLHAQLGEAVEDAEDRVLHVLRDEVAPGEGYG